MALDAVTQWPLRVASGPSLSYQSNGRFRSEADVKNAANQVSKGPDSAEGV